MTEGPREGIYLDAALAVIGEQVDERIDELSHRRRTRRRFGIAALSVFAVASGSVAAVALSTSGVGDRTPAAVVLTIEHELRCVEGESALRDAYFTLRYRTGEESVADPRRLCALAWSALQTDATRLQSATPDELIATAEGMVEESLGRVSRDDLETPPSAELDAAAPAVSVSEASFGRLSGAAAQPVMIACEGGDPTVVLAVAAAPRRPAEEILLCARAGV